MQLISKLKDAKNGSLVASHAHSQSEFDNRILYRFNIIVL